MKILTRFYLLLVLLGILSACKTISPGTLSIDQQTVSLIQQGKQLIRSNDYVNATRIFQQASARSFNQHTTVAIYLTGLSYYYREMFDAASQRFQIIIKEFPKSKYVADAQFHEALIQLSLNTPARRKQGLDQLFHLSRMTKNKPLAQDALNQIKQFLFVEAKDPWVADYYEEASEQDKAVVLEALCYRKIKSEAKGEAQQLFELFLEEGGNTTVYLDSLFQDSVPKIERIEKDILKIALFMPFHFDNGMVKYAKEIPGDIKPWLEFYEGFSLAIKNYQPQAKKRIFLQTFDTKRDTNETQRLIKELDQLYPDIVIGGVYSPPSRILAKWAKKRAIPQMVPFSRSLDVSENSQLFIINPLLKVHGTKMGNFAREVLDLKRVAIWTDGKKYSETMAEGFIQAFDTLSGRQVVKMVVDSVYDRGKDRIAAKEQVPEMVEGMMYSGFDGVYIPMEEQTTAGLILGQLNNYDFKLKVMGSYDWWKKFPSVDRELKERYRLLFTASTMYQGNEPGYEDFYQNYLKTYKYPPENWSVEGYDLGMYLLPLLDKFDYDDRIPLSTYIRLHPLIEGIHASYHFDGKQVNQFVNIGEFSNEGVFKITKEMMQDKEYWKNIKDEEEEEEEDEDEEREKR